MYVSQLRLVNFRSLCDATVRFGPGLNVVVGANATGKTNLLEGAWYALRGGSPRTRREEKLILWGAEFLRAELSLEDVSRQTTDVQIGYGLREGKRVRWKGIEVPSLEELRGRSQVFIFVPESLLLIKGSPARRRAHLDAYAAAIDRRYAAAAAEFQDALRQRNAQLAAVRAGGSTRSLDTWDAQFARAAIALGQSRRAVMADLASEFAAAAGTLAPSGEVYTVQLVTQLSSLSYEVAALVDELHRRRAGEVSRGLSLFGPQRDDLRFVEIGSVATEPIDMPKSVSASVDACASLELPAGGRDLKLFGSQGEQRLAVLALLIAEQEIAARRSGEPGILFLDDVMSELDDVRRRLLVKRLSRVGQVIVTTTNRHYFTESELESATVISLPLAGSVSDPRSSLGALDGLGEEGQRE